MAATAGGTVRGWTRGALALLLVVAAGWAIGMHPGTRADAAVAARADAPAAKVAVKAPDDPIVPVVKTDAEWKRILPAETYRVTREAGTEIAYTGRYWNNHAKGTYVCAACDLPLFSSKTKYESGTGWPSFWQPIAKSHVVTASDASFGEDRTEVRCARCGSHLGHVFDDGPPPTGLRYCMNSAALKFIPSR
jgi:peptide-methionine (R)-S-oxide reductase